MKTYQIGWSRIQSVGNHYQFQKKLLAPKLIKLKPDGDELPELQMFGAAEEWADFGSEVESKLGLEKISAWIPTKG